MAKPNLLARIDGVVSKWAGSRVGQPPWRSGSVGGVSISSLTCKPNLGDHPVGDHFVQDCGEYFVVTPDDVVDAGLGRRITSHFGQHLVDVLTALVAEQVILLDHQ